MELLLLIPLSIMIVSDWKSRNIFLGNVLLFGSMQIIIYSRIIGFQNVSHNIFQNTLLGVSITLMVFLYLKIRQKLKKGMIGTGDILFILCMTPAFPLPVFLKFMIISFMISLAFWIPINLFIKETNSIPLVSGMGLCYSVWLIFSFFFV